MAGIAERISRFWEELKRRKTDRVIVMYAAASLTLLQLADILVGALSFSHWVMTLIIIIVIVGFPVAAIFSWFFDITPGGLQKTKPAGQKRIKEMEAQIRTWRETTMISVTVIIALIIFNVLRGNIKSAEIKNAEKTIAVLPFENLSSNEVFEFNYNDIINTIIINGLRQINMLQVRERWEVLQFTTKSKSIPEIARKLNVSFLVTGELVSSKDLILIAIELVKVQKNKVSTIWSDRYLFNPKGILTEIDKIPMDIGNKLKVELSAEEKTRIRKRPTLNTAAFLNYVEGTTYQDEAFNKYLLLTMEDSAFFDLLIAESFDRAIFFYDKAIKADSNFALAYAKRAITRSWGKNAGYFTAVEHLEKCKNDIERALQIDENLIDAKVAYGFFYYYFIQDYSRAIYYFSAASVQEPKNWDYKFYMALVYRAWGEWDKSLALIREVVKHNLQNPLFLTNIGLSYQALHQYDSAIYYHNKAIAIMPRWSASYQNKIESLIHRDGNTKAAEIVLDSASLKTTGGQFPKDKIIFDLFNGKYKEALVKAENTDLAYFDNQGDKYLLLAKIYDNLNNREFAEKYYKSALVFFEGKLKENPEDSNSLSLAGICAAGIKNKEKALEYGQKALKLDENNFYRKGWRERDLAEIYVKLGEFNKALELIEDLLHKPSDFSMNMLQIDPVWKPLQKSRDYNKLISSYFSN